MEDEKTKEEMQQLFHDFSIFEKHWNQKISTLPVNYPNFLNDKSRDEEISEYFNLASSSLEQLLASGKIKSCECLTLLETELASLKKPQKGNSGIKVIFFNSSKTYQPANDLTLKELVNYTKKASEGMLSTYDKIRLEKNLKSIGTGACEPRALIELETKETIEALSHMYSFGENEVEPLSEIKLPSMVDSKKNTHRLS